MQKEALALAATPLNREPAAVNVSRACGERKRRAVAGVRAGDAAWRFGEREDAFLWARRVQRRPAALLRGAGELAGE